ncbi:DsbA family oxidoreductase [Novosphingobium sp. Gsoil 351]|uniref:DsbA family oxidoreductase n=1 Tax=Novosphingobium sp. Gsoil 351 TaxID=2675225 RepID=UPI0012B44A41|nr:DsbA family oxidoreductase [Novosphingobium sp. Gsoil 351]QGN54367.1 DsbA family oxidoreductase [Novosphingobium sp. Gsoil 351]
MTATAPQAVTIDVWSDVMCPWCIIGYKQLQTGLATLDGEIAAEIRWHPFELNPDMPPEGEDSAAHIARKYGRTPAEAEAGRERMSSIAEAAGYSFRYTGEGDPPPQRMRNTFLAHKLLTHTLAAHGPQAQTRLKLALFDAHFQQRRDVGDVEVLADIYAALGLPRHEAEVAFADPVLGERVRAEEAQAWDMNISGVPAMLVNGKYLIPGAQDPEAYANILRRVAAREAQLGER